LNARVALCGLISGYNDSDSSKAQADMRQILMKRARIQGFIILDFAPRFKEAATQLAIWIMQGKIKYRETIVEGLDQAPVALNKLFDGENTGKLLIKLTN
jgi:NADPH-dependent curcumin reductase CurA